MKFNRLFCIGSVAFAICCAFAVAQQNSDNPAEKQNAKTYTVFVPTDDDGKPHGDDYYISAELFSELKRQSNNPDSSQNRWRFVSAKYSGVFASVHNSPSQEMMISNLKAVFEVEVQAEDITIYIPAFAPLAEGTKWDGQSMQMRTVSIPIKNIVSSTNDNTNDRESDSSVSPEVGQAATVFWELPLTRQNEGKHILEIPLNPNTEQVEDAQRRITLKRIPRIADALLDLSLAPEAPPISIGESFGIVVSNSEPGKMTAKLGPIENLSMSWFDESLRVGQATVELEQFFLLSARPNQIELNAQYNFRITGGKVRQLFIATDPRMQLAGSPVFENHPGAFELFEQLSETEGITRLLFKEPISGTVSIRANYLMKNFSGIGVVRFPNIPAFRSKLVRSWLGVWVDPSLELANAPPSTMSVDRFKQEWGGTADDKLHASYDLTASTLGSSVNTAETNWTLSIRAKKPETKSRIQQSIQFRLSQTDWIFDAALESQGSVFNHSVWIPDFVEIERVDVRSVDEQRMEKTAVPVSWIFRNGIRQISETFPNAYTETGTSADSDATQILGTKPLGFRIMSIFSDSPLSGKYELSIRGRHRAVSTGVRLVPLPGIADVSVDDYQVRVYRDVSTLPHALSFPTTWEKLDDNISMKNEWEDSTPLGTWKIIPPANSSAHSEMFIEETSQFNVLPNQPRISGRQITQVSRNVNNDLFDVIAAFNLNVEEGEINVIKVKYDDLCVFPPTVTPSMKCEESREEGERFIILTPLAPWSGQVYFSLKAALNVPTESASLPKISIEGAENLDNYIVLPVDLKLKQIEWERKQLEITDQAKADEIIEYLAGIRHGTDLSESSQTSVLPFHLSDKSEVYKVVGKEFSAHINPTKSRPTVQLNDISLYLRKNGEISGISSFDLRGDGADHCVVCLPDDHELVYMTCGGVVVHGTPLSPGRWKVDIWPNNLPQKIQVVFKGRVFDTENNGQNLLTFPDDSQNENEPEKSLSFFTLGESRSISIPLPKLESVTVIGTIWAFAFESTESEKTVLYSVDQFQEPQADTDYVRQNQSASNSLALPPLSFRTAIPYIIRMDLVRLSNMEAMLNSTSGSITSSQTDVERWFSRWGTTWWGIKNELDSLLLLIDRSEQDVWKTNFFRSKSILPTTISTMIDTTTAPEAISRGFLENYDRTISTLNLQTQNRHLSQIDIPQSNAFAVFRMNHSENTLYLFGTSGGEIHSLQMTTVPYDTGFLDNTAIRMSLIVLGVLGTTLLLRGIHPIRLFRQYPCYIGSIVAIILWLGIPPGFLGLILFPLIWLAAIWPVWRRKKRALE